MSRRWSYSAVEDYTSCAWKFKLRRIDRVPSEVSLNAVAGSAFHAATEVYDRWGEWPDWSDLLTDFVIAEEKRSGQEYDTWRISGKKPSKEDGDRWMTVLGPSLMSKYEDWRANSDLVIANDLPPDRNGNTSGIEYEVSFKVGGVDVLGYIDRVMYDVNGNVGAVDIKAGARKRRTAQLKTYMLGMQKIGIPATWSSIYYARHGVHTTPDFKVWDESKLSHLYTQVSTMEAAGFYPPSPSDDCMWCSVRASCAFAL